MENDMISRSWLRNEMQEYVFPITKNNLMGAADAYHRTLHLLESVPAVDAVEVVRCKDCKHYQYGKYFPDVKFCCRIKDKNGEPVRYNFSDDDFCSRGERREENAAD